MADKKFSMDDYVDVAERIQDFMDTYPDGSLQLTDHGVMTIGSANFVYCTVAAYRAPDDERPGHGIAWEPFPGKTSFTRDSELMNAHTSAIGRAIIALGLVANRKLASRQEVRNRVADQEAAKAVPADEAKPKRKPSVPKLSPESRKALVDLYVASGWDEKQLCMALVGAGVLASVPASPPYADAIAPAMSALTPEQYAGLTATMEAEIVANTAKALDAAEVPA